MTPTFLIQTPYALAQRELGVAEIAGKRSHVRINEYLATVGQPGNDAIPWCSAFVNWCFYQAEAGAGYHGTNKGTSKANARSWLQWEHGTPTNSPKEGDLVVFWRNSPTSAKGHVAFYVREDDKYIYCLGGNQANRVCVARYPKNRLITALTYAR